MFRTKLLSSRLGRVLAVTALLAAASLHHPGDAAAETIAAGKVSHRFSESHYSTRPEIDDVLTVLRKDATS